MPWPGSTPALAVVAPFTGAWIEIRAGRNFYEIDPSLPSRERGLKYSRWLCLLPWLSSLPSRERGLKSQVRLRRPRTCCRSLHGSVD